MEIDLIDKEKDLKEVAKQYVEKELLPLENEVLENGILKDSLIERLKVRALALGLYAANIPKEFGGGGKTRTDLCIINEELGKTLPILAQTCQFPPGLLVHSGNGLAIEYLQACAAGKKNCIVVSPENNLADSNDTPAVAESGRDQWVLTGGAHIMESGNTCDFFIVFCVSHQKSGQRLSAFIVDRDAFGLSMKENPNGLNSGGQRISVLEFSNMKIDRKRLIGETGNALQLRNEWLEEARLVGAARCLGTAERCFQEARKYSIRRKRGSKPLALRQSVQWKLADMAVEIHGSRLMLYHIARELDNGIIAGYKLLIVKYLAGETAARVADLTHKIFGIEGLAANPSVAKMIDHGRICSLYPEPLDILKIKIAQAVSESF